MSDPIRRTERRRHLDASAVPVKMALLTRARELEREIADGGGYVPGENPARTPDLLGVIATEFRELAEELHYW